MQHQVLICVYLTSGLVENRHKIPDCGIFETGDRVSLVSPIIILGNESGGCNQLHIFEINLNIALVLIVYAYASQYSPI